MSLSHKDKDELKPMVDKCVHKVLGFSEPTLVIAAIQCLDKGYSRHKSRDKLSEFLDDSQASRFTEKLFKVYDDFKNGTSKKKSKKRSRDHESSREGSPDKKSKRYEEAAVIPLPQAPPDPGQPSPGQLNAEKIKEMMLNAQKTIEERKKQLIASGALIPTPPPISAMGPPTGASFQHFQEAIEKQKRAQELQAKIQSRIGMALPNFNIAAMSGMKTPTASKPTPLILDEEGRTIDAKTGEAVQLSHYTPTLKANIRAKRREQFKQEQDRMPQEISETQYFDPRVGIKPASRTRKGFKFNDPGKFVQIGARLRTKAQLDMLQTQIAESAKKTGIASATKLASILPKKKLADGEVPDVEWWDSVIIKSNTYKDFELDATGITHLVEHPAQLKAPTDSDKPINIEVILTKKERKKLRRQKREEAQKELTEKIRLGLLPPPEPKVRMANLMRVLGGEAVQDPTKVEQHVREQMAKRQKAHEESNATRKLTKEQLRDKRINKIKEDTSLGVEVALYRVLSLNNASKKFKIETNSNQLYMTGIVVLHKECNVVAVEGGPKQQKKFKRIMMHRIKWGEEIIGREKKPKEDEDDDSEDEEGKPNSAVLVWEGQVKTRAFNEMKFKACPTESFAREQFKKFGVEHYWDLAYSGSVLEAAGEDL